MTRFLLLFLLMLPVLALANDIKLLSVQAKVVRGYSSGFTTTYSLAGTNSYQDFEFFLSTDSLFDETDQFIYTKNLYTYNSTQGSYSFYSTLDLEAFPETNFIIAVVNRSQAYQETDYTNNIAISRIIYEDPAYDLDVYEFKTNDLHEQIQGNSVRLITRLKNSGNVPAILGFKIYLSYDLELDENDEEVYAHTGGSLNPGSIQSIVIYDHAATSDLEGEVHFIVKADAINMYEESNEDNNIKTVTFRFSVENYEVASGDIFSHTDYNSAGAESAISFAYTNIGETRARNSGAGFAVSYFLSTDQELGAEDALVKTASATVPNPGATKTLYQEKILIPTSFSSAQSVFIFCVIDQESKLSPDDKSNNIALLEVPLHPQKASISIAHDFYLEHFIGGYLVKPDDPLKIDLTITNDGTKDEVIKINYYLSEDPAWDEQDDFIKQVQLGPVPYRGATYAYDFEIYSQFSYPAGYYYLIQVEDPDNEVDDLQEENNISIYHIYCAESFKPEFSFEFTSVDKTEVYPGEKVRLSYYIMTFRNYEESKLYTQVHLSEDEQLDETDLLFANSLPGGYGGPVNEIIIPADWQSDKMYIITQINGERLIEENFYHNNTAFNLIHIKGEVNPAKAPVMTEIADITAPEDELISFWATATDEDTPASDLHYSLDENAPEGASIEPESGLFNWRPTEEQGPASYTFLILVSDGEMADEKEVNITIEEVNQVPLIVSEPMLVAKAGEVYQYQLMATDADIPINTLTYEAVMLPAWLNFDENTQTLSGIPDDTSPTNEIRLNTSDGSSVTEQSFILIVELEPTGLTDIAAQSSGFSVYPNPSKNSVFLMAEGTGTVKDVHAKLYTLEGRALMHVTALLDDVNKQLNNTLREENAGVYLLYIISENKAYSLKIIKY